MADADKEQCLMIGRHVRANVWLHMVASPRQFQTDMYRRLYHVLHRNDLVTKEEALFVYNVSLPERKITIYSVFDEDISSEPFVTSEHLDNYVRSVLLESSSSVAPDLLAFEFHYRTTNAQLALMETSSTLEAVRRQWLEAKVHQLAASPIPERVPISQD